MSLKAVSGIRERDELPTEARPPPARAQTRSALRPRARLATCAQAVSKPKLGWPALDRAERPRVAGRRGFRTTRYSRPHFPSGERGRARESILSVYLGEIIPTGFDIETGFVVDTRGGQSLQQDLIIVRRDYHPVFKIGGVNFFPVEAVAAVVEVKSTLSTRTLKDALRNGSSVKELDRTAAGSNYFVVGGAGGLPVQMLTLPSE